MAIQHRQTSRHMEAAHNDLDPGVAERSCNIESARILVRLDTDQPDEPEVTMRSEAGESGNPRLSAFCRSAPTVRFRAFATFFTGVRGRHCTGFIGRIAPWTERRAKTGRSPNRIPPPRP